MLAKIHRITKDREYGTIFRQGSRYFSQSFTVKYLLTNRPASRLGVIVSKSKIAKAVDRNLSKRRIRAIFREIWPKLSKPYDIVVLVKKEILTQSYTNLKREIEQFLKAKKII